MGLLDKRLASGRNTSAAGNVNNQAPSSTASPMTNIPMGGNPTNGQMGYQPTPNFPQYPPQNAVMGYAPPPQSAPQPIPQEQSVQQAPAPSPALPHEPHHVYGSKEKGNRNQETESLLSQIQDHSRHGNFQSVSMDAIKEGNRSNALKNRLDKIETEKRNIEDAVEKEITKINEEEREYVDIVTGISLFSIRSFFRGQVHSVTSGALPRPPRFFRLEITDEEKQRSNIAAVLHRIISQPASGRSSALPCFAAFLVSTFFHGKYIYTVYFSDLHPIYRIPLYTKFGGVSDLYY